jgi:hydroxymethylbilane synthase
VVDGTLSSGGQTVLGSRGSALALRQTEIVAAALRARYPDIEIAVRTVETEGDRVQDRPISQLGDKGVFVRAVEAALLAGMIDLAIHSLKDVPADVSVPGLRLAAFTVREDPRDCLIAREEQSLAGLPPGSRVGTSSLRRRAQLQALRSDLVAVPIRGNVDTRLRKLREGEYDAIILAAAGLCRLGLEGAVTEYLPVEQFTPDAGQGIIAVQAREDDPAGVLAAAIDDPASRAAAVAERAVVRALHADCRSPVGAYAEIEGERMLLRGMAADEDGERLRRASVEGSVGEAEALGAELGRRLTG